MSAEICPFPGSYPLFGSCLDAHEAFVTAARNLYLPQVIWCAPTRGLEWSGREEVIRRLLREASGMLEPEFTRLRRNRTEQQVIDEFAVRFVYAGEGIDNASIAAGDFVELKRVRVLKMHDGCCERETCIESWSLLLPNEHQSGSGRR